MTSEPFDQPAGLGDRLDDLLLMAEAWVARSRMVLVAAAVVAVAGAVAWWTLAATSADAPIEESIPLASAAPASTETTVDGQDRAIAGVGRDGPKEVVVHVVGAVRSPGLVVLVEGARISDAVAAAGGGVADADLARLNLAAPLVDGMQVRVPHVDEDGAGPAPPLVQLPVTGGGAGAAHVPSASGPVDLNLASEAELQQLPGIGPALAARIVEWRSQNGGFAVVDDLEAVPGIGPSKLADLRELVTV